MERTDSLLKTVLGQVCFAQKLQASVTAPLAGFQDLLVLAKGSVNSYKLDISSIIHFQVCTSLSAMSFRPQLAGSEPISYAEALLRIQEVASPVLINSANLAPISKQVPLIRDAGNICEDESSVPLIEAIGCRSRYTLYAPRSTPQYDASAMDGFAVNAGITESASPESPVSLCMIDSIAAGDKPLPEYEFSQYSGDVSKVCVEIMTGACFPETMPYLDSVVKIEDVVVSDKLSDDGHSMSKYVFLRQPVKRFQHRRPAGSDFRQGEVILEDGAIVEPKHVAALASLGYTGIKVMIPARDQDPWGEQASWRRALKVGILSTGTEIVSRNNVAEQSEHEGGASQQTVHDSNGPYLVSSLRNTCPWIATEYLGAVEDDEEELTSRLREAVTGGGFDVIVTSGGVSKGRYDLVRHVIEERLGGRVLFHGVKIRPGAPILFASFDRQKNQTGRSHVAFFGAPGNPLAAAVALRFFVVPYVMDCTSTTPMNCSRTSYMGPQRFSSSPICFERNQQAILTRQKPEDTTVFWLGRESVNSESSVEIMGDQASYKLRVLLEADRWVIIPPSISRVSCGERYATSAL